MRQSHLVSKTNKSAPHDADSVNARLLVQGGFVSQLAAGIYSYLPLGLRVLENIKRVIREEMDAVGGQEVLMPGLIPKAPYEATKRWDTIDVLFKLEGAGKKEFALGPTHEEVVTPLVAQFVKSYKDLPVAVYQIQDKFRNEPRAKSGLLRGREFWMKDMYSFHRSPEDLEAYYDKVTEAYANVFRRLGLDAILTEASGGVFSKYSHEFQVPTPFGEDLIYTCKKCHFAVNREIAEVKGGDQCPKCDGQIEEVKAIEVGNIFKLSTRFADDFDFTAVGEDGKKGQVWMGCYGIGISRLMGAIVEVFHDDRGIMWPKRVAPALIHLISLKSKEEATQERIDSTSETLYRELVNAGVAVLWDDRTDASPGEKFADADLLGLPLRLVVSEKTLREGSVEWKERVESDGKLVGLSDVLENVSAFQQEEV
jgi:prolyl-tRNA synthetase